MLVIAVLFGSISSFTTIVKAETEDETSSETSQEYSEKNTDNLKGPGVEEYPIWISGTQVTSANMTDILEDGGSAKYYPSSSLLELNNPSITITYKKAQIYAEGIDLIVTGSATLEYEGADYAIYVDSGNLFINDGNIKAKGARDGIGVKDGNITINGGTLKTETEEGWAGIYATKDIKISGATVKASGVSLGINSYEGNITIDGGDITSSGSDSIGAQHGNIIIEKGTIKTTGARYGLSANSITIKGGSITAEGSSRGIAAHEGDLTISGGDITATGGYMGITAHDGSITISGSDTIVSAKGPNSAITAGKSLTISTPLGIVTPKNGKVVDGKICEEDETTIADEALIKKAFTVSFDANGHGTAPNPQVVEAGKSAENPGDPEAEGYTFGGWYTESSFENYYDFSEPVTADITLYAKWLLNVSGMNLHADGTELDGTYYRPKLDLIEAIFEKESGEVAYECGHLCTDSDCSNVITTLPEKETTYYFRLYMKDPSAYDKGIQLLMFLPQIKNNVNASAEEAVIEFDWISGSPSGDAVTLQFKYTEDWIGYTISKGADASWTKGSSKGVDYIVNRNINDDKTYSLFESIEIDGTTLSASEYSVSSGSLNAVLPSAYLKTLSVGSHTVKFNFKDGSAETKLTIKQKPASYTPPVTGVE